MVSLNKLPGVAQPALQEGKYVGKVIQARLNGGGSRSRSSTSTRARWRRSATRPRWRTRSACWSPAGSPTSCGRSSTCCTWSAGATAFARCTNGCGTWCSPRTAATASSPDSGAKKRHQHGRTTRPNAWRRSCRGGRPDDLNRPLAALDPAGLGDALGGVTCVGRRRPGAGLRRPHLVRRHGDARRSLARPGPRAWRTCAPPASASDHILLHLPRPARMDGSATAATALTMFAVVVVLSERLPRRPSRLELRRGRHPVAVVLLLSSPSSRWVLGGDRATAGLGAGWSAQEFDVLGLPRRISVSWIETVLAVARAEPLGMDGTVSLDRQRRRRLRPAPAGTRLADPRLLPVGGGVGPAPRAGRAVRGPARPARRPKARARRRNDHGAGFGRRRGAAAHTTVDDLAGRIDPCAPPRKVAAAARDARRRGQMRPGTSVRLLPAAAARDSGGGSSASGGRAIPVPAAAPDAARRPVGSGAPRTWARRWWSACGDGPRQRTASEASGIGPPRRIRSGVLVGEALPPCWG